MKAAARILLIAALMVSIGAHWGVLQLAAWASMIKSYSAEKGLVEGIKETFDGAHPCAMCKKLTAQKDKDPQEKLPGSNLVQNSFAKWSGVESQIALPRPLWKELHALSHGATDWPSATTWACEPPVPPPRACA